MSETPVITMDNVMDLLEQAVDTRGPDYVYPDSDTFKGCKYQQDGAPSCLVGVALSIAGASIDQLRAMDDSDEPGMTSGSLCDDRDVPLPVSASADALDVLGIAQLAQDTGHPWGQALSNARSEWKRRTARAAK